MMKVGFAVLLLVGLAFAAERCPSDGQQHWMAHPTKCAKFLECNNGVLVEHDCIGGLIFNPNVGHCDFESNYECEDAPEIGPVGECPAVNGEFVDFLTDATRCQVFYMCNWGTAIQMECPAGLHFNPKLNVCDYPYRAGCTASQVFL